MTEQEILQAFKTGNNKEKALAALMDTYQQKLYWHIRRLVVNHEDANDVLQHVFIKVWKNLEKFRGESGLYTWLYRIASNESFTFLRKEKKRRSLSIDDEDMDLGNHLKADQHFSANEMEWKLQVAMQKLPEKQKAVFALRYYDEMPYSKISEVLETSEGALKASYHHAVKKIQKMLTED
jgi:RNA polymerase sigma-70 factor (ECF subfamily)